MSNHKVTDKSNYKLKYIKKAATKNQPWTLESCQD